MATEKKSTQAVAKKTKGAGRRKRAASTRQVEPRRQSEYSLDAGEIERALKTGTHESLLKDYFGPEAYAELRSLMRESESRALRGGPKVLILPGIMGSTIGRRLLGIFNDVYWVDPVDIAIGRLRQLRLPEEGKAFEALGVMQSVYLKLKLKLMIAGYDAEYHPFDWRKDITLLGAQLKQRIASEGGESVRLVAHSMGGLVARSAIGQGAEVKQLVMLGTPNFGSYAPVLALRAVNEVVKKVAFLDVRNSAKELASEIFNTFPGLIQMLPFPPGGTNPDFYDLATWPNDGLRPVPKALAGAPAAHAKLAAGSSNMWLIAGVNQETVTQVTRTNGGFTFGYSMAGDGTVPLEFALLPGVTTYFREAEHGGLPSDGPSIAAAIDILDRGETTRLSMKLPALQLAEVIREEPESQLRGVPFEGSRRGTMSKDEMRHLLDGFATPPQSSEIKAEPVVEAKPETSDYSHTLEGVVVGRRQKHRLEVHFCLGSIADTDARAIALGLFKNVAPTGPAGAIDERMNGTITEITQRRMFSGNVGEIFITPTGRHRLVPDFVAFVGLGDFGSISGKVLEIASENLIRAFVRARVEEFATVLIGAGSGESALGALKSLLAGIARGLLDADTNRTFRRMVICESDPAKYRQIKAEMFRLSSTPLSRDIEITFDEYAPLPALIAPQPERKAPSAPPCAYLLVHKEALSEDESEFGVRASVLTASGKSTVITGVQKCTAGDLEALLARLEGVPGVDYAAAGSKLAELTLSPDIRDVLATQKGYPLVIVHDAYMSRVPWETMALKASAPWHPATELGLSRKYTAENLSVAKWLESRVDDGVLNLLLIINPTEDLDGAKKEGKRIRDLFGDVSSCRIDSLYGKEATRTSLLSAFGSGTYDVIHYAGHAFFNPQHPSRSGIVCAEGTPLTGADLAGLSNLPSLVFFNACESGRVRKPAGYTTREAKAATSARGRGAEQLEAAVGLAEAFMRGGVANLMGTYWPVSDDGAEAFAAHFYRALINGDPIGKALLGGRQLLRDKGMKDWANYLLYGSPDFVLKRRQY